MKLISLLFAFLAGSVMAQSPTAFVVPQSGLPSGTRIQNVSNFVASLQYGVVAAAVPETYPIFTNFVMRARGQTISGANTFSGANVFSNASQVFALGKVDGAYVTNAARIDATDAYIQTAYLYGPLRITNAFPYMAFFAVGGDTDEKMTVLSGYGDTFKITLHNDDGSEGDTALEIGRDGSTALAFYVTPMLYPKGGIDGVFGGVITNINLTNVVVGATAVYVDGTMGTTNGNVNITNNAAVLVFHDTGGTADDKISKFIADADAFFLGFYNDAGTLISTPFSIARIAGVATMFSINEDLEVNGSITATDYVGQGNNKNEGIVSAGSASPTLPASATGGFLATDSVAPSADPTTGSYIWSESGNLKYRTSTSSEGSGGDNRIHNRTATTSGAGTDYSMTTSTAAVDFGTTDPSVTVPTAGTYLFLADLRITNGATAADEYRAKLRNTTTSTDVVSDGVWTCAAASQIMSVTIQGTMTCAASDVVTIYAFNNSGSARGTANSAGTRIRYVRLY